MNSLVMRRAMEYALAFDVPVVDHCEDLHLAEGGCMNEGVVSTELGLPGMPAAAEDVMVARNVALGGADRGPAASGAHQHRGVGSNGAGGEGPRDTSDGGSLPPPFTLTEEVVRGYNTYAKMNPPLRAPGRMFKRSRRACETARLM